MANSRDERHRYGQHYTPPEVATLLAAFAVRSPRDLVFDPSCGDGRLLVEAAKIKRELSAPGREADSTSLREVFGVERSASAIELARQSSACVALADFFDVEPGASLNEAMRLPSEFDAIIGNPPYIRQEVIGSRDKGRIQSRARSDRKALPEVFWPRWSGRSDIYVYFFAHSIRFLRNGGRLVFLTASSWLDAGYGAALREFLLKNFRVIAVIESAAESFFADASINTCITVLERQTNPRARQGNSIKFVQFNRTVRELLTNNRASNVLRLARKIEGHQDSSTNDSYRVRVIAQHELLGGPPSEPERAASAATVQGWGKYLRADDVFFEVITRGSSRLQSLSEMARVRFGVKTGANEFFYVNDASAEGNKSNAKQGKTNKPLFPGRLLALGEVASVRRGITTGANDFFYLKGSHGTHDRRRTSNTSRSTVGNRSPATDRRPSQLIEPRFLSPVIFSLKEIPGIVIERVKTRRMLFNCEPQRIELGGTSALEYIQRGERAGYHLRPTCRAREPWYSVARKRRPAPLIFPSKVGERWLVALNRARVFEDKKLYGIFPARGVSASVLAALLNSTWARYYAEVTCRQMTGAQAIADIDVAVAEQIMLPDPRELSLVLKNKLEAALEDLARRPVYSIFEEVKRADRRRLDRLTLEAIGFSDRLEREDLLLQLYEAVTELVRARLSRTSTGPIVSQN